jgi:hypothetical protein
MLYYNKSYNKETHMKRKQALTVDTVDMLAIQMLVRILEMYTGKPVHLRDANLTSAGDIHEELGAKRTVTVNGWFEVGDRGGFNVSGTMFIVYDKMWKPDADQPSVVTVVREKVNCSWKLPRQYSIDDRYRPSRIPAIYIDKSTEGPPAVGVRYDQRRLVT